MSGTLGLVLADQVSDGGLLLALVVAFAAGIVSFLSPCVLPLVPAYLSYVTGLSAADLGGTGVRRRVLLGTTGFVLGAAVVFVSFGALFGALGDALREHSVGLSQVFGLITIAFGLFLAGAFDKVAVLQREVRIHRLPGRGLVAAPVLGFTFALGWTPCIGPTLGTVLGLSASADGATAARGAVLSVAYCLGLGVPLVLAGLMFTRAMALSSALRSHQRALMVAGGAGLVVLGLLQLTGVWTTWAQQLQVASAPGTSPSDPPPPFWAGSRSPWRPDLHPVRWGLCSGRGPGRPGDWISARFGGGGKVSPPGAAAAAEIARNETASRGLVGR